MDFQMKTPVMSLENVLLENTYVYALTLDSVSNMNEAAGAKAK